jgi:sphingomyelin phosphodiesterase acid-like 3
MGHIPPGLDLYSSVKAGRPVTFLKAEDDLTPSLTAHPDLVRLAIFAHTHLDGMSQLQTTDAAHPVTVKSVQSISPDHGNPPSFTLARIDPRTSDLVDYTIIGAKKTAGTSPAQYTWPTPQQFPRTPTWSSSTPTPN